MLVGVRMFEFGVSCVSCGGGAHGTLALALYLCVRVCVCVRMAGWLNG